MDFTKGKLIHNQILIKPRILNDTIAEGRLFIDRTFNEMEHTDVIADVIKVCDRVTVIYEGEIVERPQELKEGDMIFVHYLGIQNALKRWRQKNLIYNPDGRVIMENGEMYIILNYPNNVFMAVRDGKPIPVNDYVIVEPTYKELEILKEKAGKAGIDVPESTEQKVKDTTQWGIVRYVGQNLTDTQFSKELTVGREVFFRKNADIPLEYDLHRTFEPDKKLCRIKRGDIYMVF